ncbi:MAG: hypothetical protein GY759_17140 [Chloroflexi bacterium]|nr:hypothetical protein [Chloroflexota bacterium]
MIGLKLASLFEAVAMSIECLLYAVQSVLWSKLKGPMPLLFSLFFSVGALFALSNLGFAMLGLGVLDWDTPFDVMVTFYQEVTIYLMPTSLVALVYAIRRA